MAEVVGGDPLRLVIRELGVLGGLAQEEPVVVLAEDRADIRAHAVERGAGAVGEADFTAVSGLVGFVAQPEGRLAAPVVFRRPDRIERRRAERGDRADVARPR
jgi:hypothetical protein